MTSFDLSECSISVPNEDYDYDIEQLTELDWAEYQFATIEYDYSVHPEAATAIRAIFNQLYEGRTKR